MCTNRRNWNHLAASRDEIEEWHDYRGYPRVSQPSLVEKDLPQSQTLRTRRVTCCPSLRMRLFSRNVLISLPPQLPHRRCSPAPFWRHSGCALLTDDRGHDLIHRPIILPTHLRPTLKTRSAVIQRSSRLSRDPRSPSPVTWLGRCSTGSSSAYSLRGDGSRGVGWGFLHFAILRTTWCKWKTTIFLAKQLYVKRSQLNGKIGTT